MNTLARTYIRKTNVSKILQSFSLSPFLSEYQHKNGWRVWFVNASSGFSAGAFPHRTISVQYKPAHLLSAQKAPNLQKSSVSSELFVVHLSEILGFIGCFDSTRRKGVSQVSCPSVVSLGSTPLSYKSRVLNFRSRDWISSHRDWKFSPCDCRPPLCIYNPPHAFQRHPAKNPTPARLQGWTLLKDLKIKSFSHICSEYQRETKVGWRIEEFFQRLKRRI